MKRPLSYKWEYSKRHLKPEIPKHIVTSKISALQFTVQKKKNTIFQKSGKTN